MRIPPGISTRVVSRFTLQIRLGEVVSARHVRPDAKVVSAD